MIRKHAGHHRFTNRHGTNADAGIVAALGQDFRVVAMHINGFLRLKNGAGRFDRKTHDDILSGRNAAEDASGMVGKKFGFALCTGAHLIGIVFTAQRCRREPIADFNRFHGIDRHHRARQIAVELVIDGLAPTRGNAGGNDLNDSADRRTLFANLLEILAPRCNNIFVRRKERVVERLGPIDMLAVDFVLA